MPRIYSINVTAGGGGSGTVTSVSGVAPIASSGGTAPIISIATATNLIAGALSAADHRSYDANRGTFVWRPSEPTPTQNVYDLWVDLYADLIKCQGPRVVIVDNSLSGGAAPMPSGSYNLKDMIFQSGSSGGSSIDVQNGCVWTGLPQGFIGQVDVTSSSSAPVYTQTGGQIVFYLDDLASMGAAGAAEFIKLDGCSVILLMKTGANLSNGAHEQFNLVNSASILVYLEEAITVGANAFRDDGTGVLTFLVAASSAQFSVSNANFSGAISTVLFTNIFLEGFNSASNLTSTNGGAALDEIHKATYRTDRVTMTNGGNKTISDGYAGIILHATGVIAGYTLKMPANPLDDQFCFITTDQTVTTLTLQVNTGQTFIGTAFTTITADLPIRYRYVSSSKSWYRV